MANRKTKKIVVTLDERRQRNLEAEARLLSDVFRRPVTASHLVQQLVDRHTWVEADA